MRCRSLFASVVPLAWSVPLVADRTSDHWSYSGATGPEHWGATCRAGKAQSPIDIRTAETSRRKLPVLAFNYRPGPLRIIDNGHSVQVNVANGSMLSVGDARFRLIQFHFHRPSEETINGRHSDMVVHLVHRDSEGRLAVVAVLLQGGADNSAIATVWRHLPLEKEREVSPTDVTINPAELLPASRAYFTYMGSLTSPPCTESVRWFVLKAPVSISAGALRKFGALYPANARPTQPLNGREVLASK